LQGNFRFFTTDPAEKRGEVAGGRIVPVRLENGRAILRIDGPPNALRRDHSTTFLDLVADVDPTAQAVRFDAGGTQVILQRGEWSDWISGDFRLIPLVKSVHGMFRVYLKTAHPHLQVYVSPVNIDPDDPELPIATPKSFSHTLAQALGPFYTQGIPEEVSAYRAGVLDRSEFLMQTHKVLADSLRMFRYELDRFSDGLLFYYFSSIDQNSHMLWARHDDELLDIYRAVDEAVGDAMQKAGAGTRLLVVSDHGFARFDRTVHLNAWLMREGLLTLDDPAKASDEEAFAHVDWSKTQAYALGLNAIYLNLEGREQGGIVSVAEKLSVLDRIAQGLMALKDPKTGEKVVEKVYFPETEFHGHNLKYSPDLVVGFRRGYRASWQTALGAVPKTVIEDNGQAWIGDHCMAADEVPGVLFANAKIQAPDPKLYDITVTILNEFGVPKAAGMIGRSVF
jgi:hypothetical protein